MLKHEVKDCYSALFANFAQSKKAKPAITAPNMH